MNTNLYEILGVSRDVDGGTLKRVYKRLVLQEHPDKGGDEENFRNINNAYKILSTPSLREIYVETGISDIEKIEEMIKVRREKKKAKATTKEELFRKIFAENGVGFTTFSHGKGIKDEKDLRNVDFNKIIPENKEKPAPLKHDLHLSIRDAYVGKTIKININCCQFCDDCNGNRYTSIVMCPMCGGTGEYKMRKIVKPGLYSVSTGTCKECLGRGSIYDLSTMCKRCNMTGLITVKKTHEVTIHPGIKHGDIICIEGGNGDKLGYTEKSDLHLVIHIKNNRNFKRVQNDILIRCKISLKEALCGFKKEFVHLSGRRITISSHKIIQQSQKQKIKGLGFPFKEPNETLIKYGDLIVEYDIQIPKRITNEFKELCKIHLD